MSEWNQDYQDRVITVSNQLRLLTQYFDYEVICDFKKDTPKVLEDVEDVLSELIGLIVDLNKEIENGKTE